MDKEKELLEQYNEIRKKLDEDPIPEHRYIGDPDMDKQSNELSVEFRKESLDRCILRMDPKINEVDFFR